MYMTVGDLKEMLANYSDDAEVGFVGLQQGAYHAVEIDDTCYDYDQGDGIIYLVETEDNEE